MGVPQEAILQFVNKQKQLLRDTYDVAWQRGVDSYDPDADPDPGVAADISQDGFYPPIVIQGAPLTGVALLAARRLQSYQPPANPDPVRRAVALVPSYTSLNKMADELALLQPVFNIASFLTGSKSKMREAGGSSIAMAGMLFSHLKGIDLDPLADLLDYYKVGLVSWQAVQAEVTKMQAEAAGQQAAASGASQQVAQAVGSLVVHQRGFEALKTFVDAWAENPEMDQAIIDAQTPGGLVSAALSRLAVSTQAFSEALQNWVNANTYRLDAGDSTAWAGEQVGYAEAADADGQLLEWDDTGDDRECEDCRHLASMPPMALADWPCQPGDGATTCSVGCFTPDTMVEGAFVSGLEIAYAGQMIELETESGARVTLTPNHPVATLRGFVPAGELCPGEYLFHRVGWQDSVGVVEFHSPTDDDDHGPAMIEQVFRSLEELSGHLSVTSRGNDFHGDGRRITDGQINVVAADRILISHLQANFFQHYRQCSLEHAVELSATLSTVTSQQLAVAYFSPSCGCPCCRALTFDKSTIGFDPFPFQALRIGLATQFNARLGQPAGECPSADTNFIAQLLERGSGEIVPDQLVKVNRVRKWCGHVYDLQSTTGWLLAGSIVCSNCRCSLTVSDQQVVPGDIYNPQNLMTGDQSAVLSKMNNNQVAALNAMMPDAAYLD